MRRQFVHDSWPHARGHDGIVRREICASEIEINGRCSVGLVHRIENALGVAVCRRCEASPARMSRSPANKKCRYAGDTVGISAARSSPR
jgi:hypothetical protein